MPSLGPDIRRCVAVSLNYQMASSVGVALRNKPKGKSPLFKVDRIKRPLLIVQGANDVRVKRQESEQMVEALRKAGKEVTNLFFKDEGHSIRSWKNRLLFYRKVEDFLARHLGGRSAGFDYFELGRYIF